MDLTFNQSNVLALDLGTQLGWAYARKGAIKEHGSFSLKAKTSLKHKEDPSIRFWNFIQWLEKFGKKNEIDVVVFELVRRHLGTQSAHVYGGFLGVLSLFTQKHSIPCSGVAVQTIKKKITGKGNASKDEVLQAVCALGYNVVDDNEADAIALLTLALSVMNDG